MKIKDTSFISLVNAQAYESFVTKDWDLIADLFPPCHHATAQGQYLDISND